MEVLRSFGMRPLPGVRLTLVTRDMHTPYSGMLPGYISGFYSYDDCHIDLAGLASFAKARVIHQEASGIDAKVGPWGGGHMGLYGGWPSACMLVLGLGVLRWVQKTLYPAGQGRLIRDSVLAPSP